MPPTFIAHNVRLADGSFTLSADKPEMRVADHAVQSVCRVLASLWPGDRAGVRVADIGCLEGGYTAAIASMGFEAVGIEVRSENFAACEFVRDGMKLPNLRFVNDDAWNTAKYGPFDAVFCGGLLYHLDRPKEFLRMLSSATKRIAIINTHFARRSGVFRGVAASLPYRVRLLLARLGLANRHALSVIADNEGLRGRWYTEFDSDASFAKRDENRWASWGNRDSFWPCREWLLHAIRDAGFDVVMEQFDHLHGYFDADIPTALTNGYYSRHDRGIFVGMKSDYRLEPKP